MTAGPVEVISVGSANLDYAVKVPTIPVPGQTVLGGDLKLIPGGKGANQAVAAARLGRRTAIIGRVGDDQAGVTLRDSLESAGVDTRGLKTTPGVPSGAALIAIGGGDNAIVVSPGANARLCAADIEDGLSAGLLSRAAVVLLQLEVPLEAVTAAARRARGTVVLNPAPAPAAPLPSELLDRVDVLVPNQTELASLAAGVAGTSGLAGGVDADSAVELARSLPAASVVVTLGAGGALAVTSAEAIHVPAPSVKAVDTTAAGDAFCGALADALAGGADLVDATRWAVRVGAATTLRLGAQPSLPTPAEVEALLNAF